MSISRVSQTVTPSYLSTPQALEGPDNSLEKLAYVVGETLQRWWAKLPSFPVALAVPLFKNNHGDTVENLKALSAPTTRQEVEKRAKKQMTWEGPYEEYTTAHLMDRMVDDVLGLWDEGPLAQQNFGIFYGLSGYYLFSCTSKIQLFNSEELFGEEDANAYYSNCKIAFPAQRAIFREIPSHLSTLAHEIEHAVLEYSLGILFPNNLEARAQALRLRHTDVQACWQKLNTLYTLLERSMHEPQLLSLPELVMLNTTYKRKQKYQIEILGLNYVLRPISDDPFTQFVASYESAFGTFSEVRSKFNNQTLYQEAAAYLMSAADESLISQACPDYYQSCLKRNRAVTATLLVRRENALLT